LNVNGLAEAARAEGLAWIQRTLQCELAPEFHAGFREPVVAHRALLTRRVQPDPSNKGGGGLPR
jgi:hypothetical protein